MSTPDTIIKQVKKLEEYYNYILANLQDEYRATIFFNHSNLNTDISERIKCEDILIQALDKYDNYYITSIKNSEKTTNILVNTNTIYELMEKAFKHSGGAEYEKDLKQLKITFDHALSLYQQNHNENILSKFTDIYELLIELLGNYKVHQDGSLINKGYKEYLISIIADYKEAGHDTVIKQSMCEIPITSSTNHHVMFNYNNLIPCYIAYHLLMLNKYDVKKCKVSIEKFKKSGTDTSHNKLSILMVVDRIIDSIIIFDHKGLNIKMLADNDYECGKKDLLNKSVASTMSKNNQQALEETYAMIERSSCISIYDETDQTLLSVKDREAMMKRYEKMIQDSLTIYSDLTQNIFIEAASYKEMKKNTHDFSFLIRSIYDTINSLNYDQIDPYSIDLEYEEEQKIIFIDYYAALMDGLELQFLIDNLQVDGIELFRNNLALNKKLEKISGVKDQGYTEMESFNTLLKWKEWSYLYPLAYLSLWSLLDKKVAKRIALQLAKRFKRREDEYKSHEFESKLDHICTALKDFNFREFVLAKPQYFF